MSKYPNLDGGHQGPADKAPEIPVSDGPKSALPPPVGPERRLLYFLCKKTYAKDQPGASPDADIRKNIDWQFSFVSVEFFDTKEAAVAKKTHSLDQIGEIRDPGDIIHIKVAK